MARIVPQPIRAAAVVLCHGGRQRELPHRETMGMDVVALTAQHTGRGTVGNGVADYWMCWVGWRHNKAGAHLRKLNRRLRVLLN